MSLRNFIWMLVLIITGCQPKYLDKDDLVSYIQDEFNGFSTSSTGGGITFDMTYRPNDLIIYQTVGDDPDSSEYWTAKNQYLNFSYFVLSMHVKGKNALYAGSADLESFSDNLQTLSFEMASKLQLITSNQDTVGVVDYIFSRSYGKGPSTLMFVFDNRKILESQRFTLHLRDFGMHTGDQRFDFSTECILNSPRLKTYKAFEVINL